MNPSPVILLTLDHLRAFAAWLTHGPGTLRQVAGRADMHLIDLHPRTVELVALGALQPMAQSETEGPIYAVQLSDVATPSVTDAVERKLNSLPVAEQVSIAAGIMARHGRRGRIVPATEQEEISLTGSAAEAAPTLSSQPSTLNSSAFTLE